MYELFCIMSVAGRPEWVGCECVSCEFLPTARFRLLDDHCNPMRIGFDFNVFVGVLAPPSVYTFEAHCSRLPTPSVSIAPGASVDGAVAHPMLQRGTWARMRA